jgi:putative restriction endonuclease
MLVQQRLGQGAFRLLVTDAYQRRCAVTGERTLPVLDAAHIKPYAASGPHDPHAQFDAGYITVSAIRGVPRVARRHGVPRMSCERDHPIR